VKNWSYVLVLLAISLALFAIPIVKAAIPYGANVDNSAADETADPSEPGNDTAYAGNVSELIISGFSTTQAWHGYFGNVTGTIQLADGTNNVMYNWSLASPNGEVYASTNNSIFWAYVQCFNYTADGTLNAADNDQGGTTSLYGVNLTGLEGQYGINYTVDDVDGVNETFIYNDAINGHRTFYTANKEFSDGECQSTRIYDDTMTGVKDHFEEVLLYEPSTASVVFASLLNEDEAGFDQNAHDFEMLVLDDGHGTDTDSTTYYFFVELQ
jgi:hypothetical protein